MGATSDFCERHGYPCWCGETRASIFCKQLFGRRSFVVLRCSGCGTHRLLPRALGDDRSAIDLYNTYYIFRGTRDQEGAAESRAIERMQKVKVAFTAGAHVMDVGCGDGLIINAIARDFGCVGRGIDVDERRIAFARAHRRHASFEAGLFHPDRMTESYPLVIASAIIEHVIDPVAFLCSLRGTLDDGGAIYILTPNAGSLSYGILRSWWRELLSVGEHIYLFTPASLQQCAGAAGLAVASYDSDFDLSRFAFKFLPLRDAIISAWAIYRELIKRLALLHHRQGNGDILFARLIIADR